MEVPLSTQVTIVMYHYVRDLAKSRFPAIHGLSLDGFRGQLDYLSRHYEVVSMEAVLDALENGGQGLPPRAVLLTFDDGYVDHYANVFPLLDERRLPGAFFPSAQPVLEDRVLQVNKIHFILASVPRPEALLPEVTAAIDARRERFGLKSAAEYWASFDEPGRFDGREANFIKRMLQRNLPFEARKDIVDELFRRHVTADEAAFSRELYASIDQLRCMRSHGMFIGNHGYAHSWLNRVDRATQQRSISLSLDFLRVIDPDLQRWVMCYPYGAYDAATLDVLRSMGCAAGLSTEVGIADLARNDRLLLPRLDTNDLPRDPIAPPAPWTARMDIGVPA
jgi:peptidoglycan/xylan/chitin deacetylase (PgdA/CDA1 family)